MNEIITKVEKKYVKLGVHWNNIWINFCSFGFSRDNSFYFSSKFHSQGSLEFGPAVLKDNHLFNQAPDQFHLIEHGLHVSLHPKGQLMHVRENQNKKILFSRKMEWFPIKQPFNLLVLYSPPLDTCNPEKDKSDFYTQVPNNYKDSIQIRVDVFPKDTKEHHPYIASIWIFWGRCPEYLVRISMNLIKQRTPVLLYWPNDTNLRL